ncbi:MAG: hypothetical protein ACP5D7_07420 [Limnospira sp.]
MLSLSICLLLLTYTVFGWALYELHLQIHIWGALELGIVFLALLYTVPLNRLKRPLNAWFKSNIGFFLSVIFGAFLIVVLATWLEIFTTTLMALSATALTRMELQTRNVKSWKAFFVLCAVSMSGLALGSGLHHLAGLLIIDR